MGSAWCLPDAIHLTENLCHVSHKSSVIVLMATNQGKYRRQDEIKVTNACITEHAMRVLQNSMVALRLLRAGTDRTLRTMF